ncbi:Detected protein of confused Function [Hibiscus syriacus]|uniref:Detected protein of confused Function n=1 Tax=Hibiscus syriacus TaxID=106335 RepID=A0A6A2ZEC0_HIBSY|nr:Detected protein of confused Function [Hibiscus syriacus]
MDDKLAQELYSESLQLSNLQLGHSSTANDSCEADIQADDGSLWGGSDEELDKTSDLDREWQRRHDQFHTQSVPVGYNWGITRGVTSALDCLPDVLMERLIEKQEKRDKFRELHRYVNSLSALDALKLFHDYILTKKATEQSKSTEVSGSVDGAQEKSSNSAGLGTYAATLQSLILDSPEIQVQFFHQEVSGPDLC